MASIAARTFLEIRFGGPGSAGAGAWSRAASARLAGAGGVMFFHVRHLGRLPRGRNALNVTFSNGPP
jgi:hypothetical protein